MDTYYKIKGSTMKEIADCTRALIAIKGTLTPAQIIYYLRLLSDDWNLKTEAIDEFEQIICHTPDINLQQCLTDMSVALQDEPRLNTYVDILQDNFHIQSPKMSLSANLIDNYIANPYSGELICELNSYDEQMIKTEFNKLAHLRTSWETYNTIQTIDIGNIGVLDIDINIIPKERITSIEVKKIT